MTKARDLADFVSAGNPLADGTIDVADINGITATTTELNYTDGVTSNIQTQLDAKVDLAGDTMTGNLAFGDSVKATYGASADLEIYHDGTDSYIQDAGTGFLIIGGSQYGTRIKNHLGNDLLTAYDSTAELKYNGSAKLATTSTGVAVTGDATFADNGKAIFGAGSDLSIWHDGTASYIHDNGVGSLNIRADQLRIESADGSETLAVFNQNSDVFLRHDNTTRLATTATGIDVTGTITADGLTLEDNQNIIVGSSGDLYIYHNGSNSHIEDRGTGDLVLKANNNFYVQDYGTNETMIRADSNGAVNLYYDNSLKFQTTSYGVSVSGSAVATTYIGSLSGAITLNFDNSQNFVITMTGNLTLSNPTTEKVGQSGFIVFIQDGTGGRTVSLGTDYETAGGAGLTLSSTANTTDVVPYIVAASGRILLGTPQLAFS